MAFFADLFCRQLGICTSCCIPTGFLLHSAGFFHGGLDLAEDGADVFGGGGGFEGGFDGTAAFVSEHDDQAGAEMFHGVFDAP